MQLVKEIGKDAIEGAKLLVGDGKDAAKKAAEKSKAAAAAAAEKAATTSVASTVARVKESAKAVVSKKDERAPGAYSRVGTAFAIDDDDDDEELEDLSALHHELVSSAQKSVRDSTEQVRWLQEERAEKQKLQQQVALANAVAAEVEPELRAHGLTIDAPVSRRTRLVQWCRAPCRGMPCSVL